MGETGIQKTIRLAIGRIAIVFRNNFGKLPDLTGRWVSFGVGPEGGGGSDLIGWKSVTITPEMVGKKFAIFVAIETKATDGKTNKKRLEAQSNFVQQVHKAGGLAGFARTVEEAEAILRGELVLLESK